MKTILLAILAPVALAAGFLTTGVTARRGDNNVGKRRDFNFLPALCIIFFVAVIGGCGDSPSSLHFAAKSGDAARAKRLIDNGADVDATMEGDVTPLIIATIAGNSEVMLALIEAGADMNARADGGLAALHFAVGHNHTKSALVLIRARADVDAKEDEGSTPLYFAALMGRAEIARALIKGGADINAKGEEGYTPLHLAAIDYRSEVVRDAVAELGGNIVGDGHAEIALALVKAGADLHIRNDEGQTALEIAIEEHGKDSDIARALQEAMGKQGNK